MQNKNKNISLMVILSYITIYLVWGSTYFFIRLSVQTIPSYYKEQKMPFFFFGLPMILFGLFTMIYGEAILNQVKEK